MLRDEDDATVLQDEDASEYPVYRGQAIDDLFDERGRHELVLSIGHMTYPVDKRQRRIKWLCFVKTESLSVVDSCSFSVADGLGGRDEFVGAPPFQIDRTSACVSEAIEVIVTVHYKSWTKAPPTLHTHEVVLRPAGRGGTEEKFVVLHDPRLVDRPPISWAEYEAQPGQYIARGTASVAATAKGSWAGPALAAKPPPSHQDWRAFPGLGGKNRPTTGTSFASALTSGGAARSAGGGAAAGAGGGGGGGGGGIMDFAPIRPSHPHSYSSPDLPRVAAFAKSSSDPAPHVAVPAAATAAAAAPARELSTPPPPIAPPFTPQSSRSDRSLSTPPRHSTPHTTFDVSDAYRSPAAPFGGRDTSGTPSGTPGGSGSGRGGGGGGEQDHAWLASVATGDVDVVLRWLQRLGLSDYVPAFRQHSVDGKTLIALTEKDLEDDLGVTRAKRRLMLEIDAVRSAAPPPPPPPVRRMPSEPARGYTLADDLEPFELKQVMMHVARSQVGSGSDERGGGGGGSSGGGGGGLHAPPKPETRIEVVRVQRVVNHYLSYMLEKTCKALCGPLENRAMPPQVRACRVQMTSEPRRMPSAPLLLRSLTAR